MKWVVGSMSYTLDSHYSFNLYHCIFSIGITIDILFVYSYFLYMYAYTSISINFDWYFIFHIYMCFICAYYISISLSTNFGYAKFDLVLNDNYFQIGTYTSLCIIFIRIS